MSDKYGISLNSFKEWLARLDTMELIDAETMVREARQRKKDEGRVTLHEVSADGITVGYFRKDDVKGALEYLLENVDDLDGDIQMSHIRVPESEVDERLANRWWTP